MDDLIADFLTETNESIADLDVALVKLEQTPDDKETLSLIFRLVHTIKGTCGFLGLPRLERVAHAAENVLGKIRDGVLAATPDTVTLILSALDRIKLIVAGLAATGNEPAGDDGALVEALNATATGEVPKASEPVVLAEPEPEPEDLPSADSPPSPPVAEKPASAPAFPAVAAPDPAPQAEPVSTAQTIRVTVDVLEDLMTLVSELVLTRNQLLQLARSQEENIGFAVPLQRLSHITSDLQEGVMKTRMQPIGNAWNKLPRLVRDLARETGKKIELVMLGAETELDRQVLELIKDPLTHMVRNSGDHGLESPADRRAAGKSETGRITLNAFHEGGHIIIEISDDGRGLPLDNHSGGDQKLAVPLGLVARLEDIPREKIEISCGSPVTQYRGKLMPLVAMSSGVDADKPRQPVLVFNDGDRTMGLMVDEIVDVVEDRLHIELSGSRPGLLGSAVIGGVATDVIDTGYWLTQAWQDWFHRAPEADTAAKARHVLVVEDSDFFRQLLTPILGASGYHVTPASSAAEALHSRGARQRCVVEAADDCIVSARRPGGYRGRSRCRVHRLCRQVPT